MFSGIEGAVTGYCCECVSYLISMIRTILLAVPLLFPCNSLAQASDRQEIDFAISSLVKQFTDGVAVNYPEYRFVAFGPIFGGSSNDAIAFFSIEGFGGTNRHVEYIAFFASVPKRGAGDAPTRPFRLVAAASIGGRGWRTFDWKSVQFAQDAVSVAGRKYGARDPMCCPSLAFKTTFRVKDGSVVEAK